MTDLNLETWMTHLASAIGNRKLVELFIPGSHDSAINHDCVTSRSLLDGASADIGPDAPSELKTGIISVLLKPPLSFILGTTSLMVDNIIRGWSVTQTLSLTDQLYAGIRYFDLRIAKVNGVFKFTHTLLSYTDIFTLLSPVRDFMRSHEGEVLILHCQHLYEMGGDDYDALLDGLRSLFGDMICTSSEFPIDNTPFGTFISHNKRILLVWKNGPVNSLSNRNFGVVYTEDETLKNPYEETDRMRHKDRLVAYLLDEQKGRLKPDPKLSVIQGIFDYSHLELTDLATSNLLTYEAGLNKHLYTHLLPKLNTQNGFIYMVDYVSHPDNQATEYVVGLNR